MPTASRPASHRPSSWPGAKISRSHLASKLRAVEALGSIGWQGRRGRSVMWVSSGFRQEYATAQAVKLAIIDAAFAACFRPQPGKKPRAAGRYLSASDAPSGAASLGVP